MKGERVLTFTGTRSGFMRYLQGELSAEEWWGPTTYSWHLTVGDA